LCGEKCNWDDIEYKDGKAKAGESYPSIDHIIPLSKGGTQSWENVKLAHRHCNSIKGVYEARRMGTKYSASV
jgi:5-methylcytosine-specific restriction endonuclease McrA